ncbi:MAG: O-antigen polysaccharide polymerase Wzy, partial [Solobacterium sp.]|nr:O-antigen polysaccharide polymerase Wzy [Solobacterium sp.]
KATFGIGYSLTAEAYHNFSWFGIIAIFFIGVIVAQILNCTKNKLSPFRYYVQMSMTYALFTLPRRGIYDLFNYLFYFVFVFWLLRKISIAIDSKKSVTE